MAPRHRLHVELAAWVGEVGPDDGLDSMTIPFHSQRGRHVQQDRKALQLCRQVEQALSLALCDVAEADPEELVDDAEREDFDEYAGYAEYAAAEGLTEGDGSDDVDPETEIFGRITVVSVLPASDGGHLTVTVGPLDPDDDLDRDEVLAALERVAGRLRSEVAAAIHRRKTPELHYTFVSSNATEGD